MGTVVASRAERIAAALQKLDDNTEAGELERHTTAIHAAMLSLLASRRANGFDIGTDEDGAFARPRTKTAGPARELRDLVAKCRKAVAGKISAEQWAVTWAAAPDRVRSLPRPVLVDTPEGLTIDRSAIALGFTAPSSYRIIVPKPETVLPAIEAELARLAVAPNKKTRERNADEAKAIEAIRAAYASITGHEGGRVIKEGKLVGRLVRLGRQIDDIFCTTLFAGVDSRRLR